MTPGSYYEDEMRFLHAIKRLRKARGLTQGQLAEITAIDQARISKIEAGSMNVEASTLTAIASALDVEVVLVPRRVLGPVQSLIDNHLKQSAQAEPARPVPSVRDELLIPDDIDDDEPSMGPRI
jgi:transcriptional regulator with XRE-family HTH domain